ncbi:hypothetical protein ABZP36_028531 [Zizania latifolia]
MSSQIWGSCEKHQQNCAKCFVICLCPYIHASICVGTSYQALLTTISHLLILVATHISDEYLPQTFFPVTIACLFLNRIFVVDNYRAMLTLESSSQSEQASQQPRSSSQPKRIAKIVFCIFFM